jgi:hypothetical protein
MVTIVEKLNDLVSNDDVLPVRVSQECLIQGKKSYPSKCAGALAIAEALGCPGMTGLTILVGHLTKKHLSDRVVIKTKEDPTFKWIAWIVNSPGKSGFHPKKYDDGKQKTPGAMMLERWSKEPIVKLTPDCAAYLHSREARDKQNEYRVTTPSNGVYRVFNG